MSGNGPNSGIEVLPLTAKQQARFWSKVERGDKHKCWPWKAATYLGYGRVGITQNGKSKNHKANRIAFCIHNGGLESGKVVAHSCDNPLCCNPQHLFLTTQRGNILDAKSKGRWNPVRPSGDYHWMRLRPESVNRNSWGIFSHK